MFQNGKIVCVSADPANYRSQDSKPGESQFVVSCGTLLDFWECPSRWIAGYERPGGSAKKWRRMLETLHMRAERFPELFAVRPDTYQVAVNKCPSCGSVSEAEVCRKCGLRRRRDLAQRPWAGGADYCKKWTEQAEKRNQTVVRTEEHQGAQAAAERLMKDPVIKNWRGASEVHVWVAGEWHDAETGLTIPVRTLIPYVPKEGTEWDYALGSLKVTRAAVENLWRRQAFYANYHVRAAWSLDLWNSATGDSRNEWYVVVSEAMEPYETARRALGPMFLELGRRTFNTMLARYCQCLAGKIWPSYDLGKEGKEAWTVVETEPWMHQGDGSPGPTVPTPPNAGPEASEEGVREAA